MVKGIRLGTECFFKRDKKLPKISFHMHFNGEARKHDTQVDFNHVKPQ